MSDWTRLAACPAGVQSFLTIHAGIVRRVERCAAAFAAIIARLVECTDRRPPIPTPMASFKGDDGRRDARLILSGVGEQGESWTRYGCVQAPSS
jgi:hypothetical protein